MRPKLPINLLVQIANLLDFQSLFQFAVLFKRLRKELFVSKLLQNIHHVKFSWVFGEAEPTVKYQISDQEWTESP